jgi:hypothetical protein
LSTSTTIEVKNIDHLEIARTSATYSSYLGRERAFFTVSCSLFPIEPK